MKLTYRDFEFEIEHFTNYFDPFIYQQYKYDDLKEEYQINFGNVRAEMLVLKNDIEIHFGEFYAEEKAFIKCVQLETYFEDKQNILAFYQYIRELSPYRVRLLTELGPIKQYET